MFTSGVCLVFTSVVCLGVVVALGLTDDTYCFLMASFSLHICFSASLIAVKLFVISAFFSLDRRDSFTRL